MASSPFSASGFTCAVFTNQGMHFTRSQLKLALAERADAGEAFFYPIHQH